MQKNINMSMVKKKKSPTFIDETISFKLTIIIQERDLYIMIHSLGRCNYFQVTPVCLF